jgi:hypothetical protein
LPQEQILAFGDRWKVLRRVSFGDGEAIAHLELPDQYESDLKVYPLHPGLLDIASGSAFTLITGPTAESSLVVPLSYGRLRIKGRLPRRLVSHVRLQPGSKDGVGILDVTIANDQGEVAAEIEGYVVKAVDPRVLRAYRHGDASATPLEKWIEHGILADEGFDLLGRVLGQKQEVQVLVSPLARERQSRPRLQRQQTSAQPVMRRATRSS